MLKNVALIFSITTLCFVGLQACNCHDKKNPPVKTEDGKLAFIATQEAGLLVCDKSEKNCIKQENTKEQELLLTCKDCK